jgi:hypothetical protein
MIGKNYAVGIFIIEVLLFLSEIVMASKSERNRKLKKAKSIVGLDFIDLKQGYKTSISIFRISLFISYLVLVILYFDANENNLTESVLLYFLGGVLIYMLSLMSIKTFIFYPDYFLVSAPFNVLRKEVLISYSSISDFRLYRALYNNFLLKIKMKSGEVVRIQFSGSSVPMNNLILKLILNSKTGMKNDFIQRKWRRRKRDF